MIKFNSTMIAAAALASLVMPSLAYAGDLGEAFKYYRAQKREIRDQKHDVKDQYLNGDLTKDEFKAQKKDLIAQVDDVNDTIEDLQASR